MDATTHNLTLRLRSLEERTRRDRVTVQTWVDEMRAYVKGLEDRVEVLERRQYDDDARMSAVLEVTARSDCVGRRIR